LIRTRSSQMAFSIKQTLDKIYFSVYNILLILGNNIFCMLYATIIAHKHYHIKCAINRSTHTFGAISHTIA
jgi:hypothetical protein